MIEKSVREKVFILLDENFNDDSLPNFRTIHTYSEQLKIKINT